MGDELVVASSKTKIYIGIDSEWNKRIDNSSAVETNVLLQKNDGSLVSMRLIWCEDKEMLFVPPKMHGYFNVDEFSDKYQIEISNEITPLTNKTKPMWKKKLERIRLIKEVNSAPVISLKEFRQLETPDKLYAVGFAEETNFQMQFIKGRDCAGKKHNPQKAVGILRGKDGKLRRIGKVIICTKCRRTYIDDSTRAFFNPADYPSYTFKDWKVIMDELFLDFQNKKKLKVVKTEEKKLQKLKEREEQEKLKLSIKKLRDSYKTKYPYSVPQKPGDVIILDEHREVCVGMDPYHIPDPRRHAFIDCTVGLINNERTQYTLYEQFKYCPTCRKYYYLQEGYFRVLYEKHGKLYQIKKCKKIAKQSGSNNPSIQQKLRQQSDDLQPKTEENTFPNLTHIGAKDFLVRTGSFSCRSKGHKCEEITACLTVIHPNSIIQDVYLSGWYCKNCKCYFISESDYQKVDRMGTVVAQIFTEKEWINHRNDYRSFSELSSESLLYKMGYNVNASIGLRDHQRQDILAAAVDFKLMTKREVADFLTWLINQRKNRSNFQDAVYKWEKDREFIQSYRLDTKHYTRIKSITLKESRS